MAGMRAMLLALTLLLVATPALAHGSRCVYDVDHNGVVTEADAFAVADRFGTSGLTFGVGTLRERGAMPSEPRPAPSLAPAKLRQRFPFERCKDGAGHNFSRSVGRHIVCGQCGKRWANYYAALQRVLKRNGATGVVP